MPLKIPLLQILPRRTRTSEVVRAGEILLNPHIEGFVDSKTDYSFQSFLERAQPRAQSGD